MKPYGRYKTIKSGNKWKIDFHIHEKGKKVLNWWEVICDNLSRSKMKQITKKYIDNEKDIDIY